MRINTVLPGLILTGLCLPALGENHSEHGHGDADPLLAKVMIDQLEVGEDTNRLDAQAWLGKDLDKLWLKLDISQQDGNQSRELQALYSHAISPYWDVQLGLRQDSQTDRGPSRTWGVLGIQGLAPYFFEVEAALFVGEQGRSGARLKAEYDLLFTQKLILSPALALNAYGQNDPATGTGAGLAESEAGLRLRYELRRELAPYVGINWHKAYGTTADLRRASGEHASEYQWVLGLRAWF